METYYTRVMELLSLGTTPDGVHQMEVALTHEGGQDTYVIDLDEFTFLELAALQPLNGGRARLSPYPKWDPYRSTYYSVIIRTTGVSRETLYFSCSEAYMDQIKQMGTQSPLSAPGGDEQREGVVRKAAAEKLKSIFKARLRPSLLHSVYAKAPRLVNLLLIGFILLLLQAVPYHSKANPAAHLAGNADGAQEETTVSGSNEGVVPTFASMSGLSGGTGSLSAVLGNQKSPPEALQPPQAGAAIQGQPAAQVQQPVTQKNYEVIDIDGDEKFFGLPKQYVALTFDDGPSRYTKKIVDILTKHKLAATFLFIGENAKRNPDAVAYASQQGMSIGNHSWDHPDMVKLSPEDQSKNLSRTASLLESLTHTPVTLFRPPYGSINDQLFAAARNLHMKTLMWNRDPEDWNHKKPGDIVKYFHGVNAAGGVYVLHEDKSTLDALPDILDYLQSKNLTFAIFK